MGRAQRKSTVHELCTAHSARRRKKKRGSHKPRRTYDNIYIIIIYEKSQMYHPCGARFARPIISTAIIIAHARAYRGPRPQPRRESGPVETAPTVPVATALYIYNTEYSCVVKLDLCTRCYNWHPISCTTSVSGSTVVLPI